MITVHDLFWNSLRFFSWIPVNTPVELWIVFALNNPSNLVLRINYLAIDEYPI